MCEKFQFCPNIQLNKVSTRRNAALKMRRKYGSCRTVQPEDVSYIISLKSDNKLRFKKKLQGKN